MMRFVLEALCVLALWVPQLLAQTVVDLSVGVGRGLGASDAGDRNLMALDATLAHSVRRVHYGAIPVALAAHTTPSFGGTACLALPGLACRLFPNLGSVALLSGWSHHADMSRGPRLLAGPAIVWNDSNSKTGVGLMLRADIAESLGRHAAFVVGAQSVIAPKWQGERVATGAVTVGVRIH